jgi:hypothetical protein
MKAVETLERRVSVLEKVLNKPDTQDGWCSFKANLILPEANIDGLHFNETKVHAVFERKEDGWWHSLDIFGLSARNTENDNGRDILTKYLSRYNFKNCIRQQLPEEIFGESVMHADIEVSLPKDGEGVKRYNGVACAYWLKEPYSGSTTGFCDVDRSGAATLNLARAVYGFAPAFRVL